MSERKSSTKSSFEILSGSKHDNRVNRRHNLKFKFHGLAGTDTRVRIHGYEVAGTRVRIRAAGTRVRVQQVFSKKNLIGPSQTLTRVLVYPSIPGHEYRYHEYQARIHRYELYPADFRLLANPYPHGTKSPKSFCIIKKKLYIL
jgi:hypothetical protein